jgi:hypothetical protein
MSSSRCRTSSPPPPRDAEVDETEGADDLPPSSPPQNIDRNSKAGSGSSDWSGEDLPLDYGDEWIFPLDEQPRSPSIVGRERSASPYQERPPPRQHAKRAREAAESAGVPSATAGMTVGEKRAYERVEERWHRVREVSDRAFLPSRSLLCSTC